MTDGNVTMLPTASREAVVQTIDAIAREATAAGWRVTKLGPNYLSATRSTDSGLTEQVSAAIVAGKLHASRIVVLDTADAKSVVSRWLGSPS